MPSVIQRTHRRQPSDSRARGRRGIRPAVAQRPPGLGAAPAAGRRKAGLGHRRRLGGRQSGRIGQGRGAPGAARREQAAQTKPWPPLTRVDVLVDDRCLAGQRGGDRRKRQYAAQQQDQHHPRGGGVASPFHARQQLAIHRHKQQRGDGGPHDCAVKRQQAAAHGQGGCGQQQRRHQTGLAKAVERTVRTFAQVRPQVVQSGRVEEVKAGLFGWVCVRGSSLLPCRTQRPAAQVCWGVRSVGKRTVTDRLSG